MHRFAGRTILIATACLGACTWGTYDGKGVGGDGGNDKDSGADAFAWPSQTIDPTVGGTATSDDGLFSVIFPTGSLNDRSDVTISRNFDAKDLPAFCKTKSVSCWQSAYAVTLKSSKGVGNTFLTGTVRLSFNIGPSAFAQNQTFIVKVGPDQSMPGVWPPSTKVVNAFEPAGSASYLGPYAIVNAFGQVSATTSCNGSNVCDSCAQACCPGQSFSAPPAAGIHESCVCAGPSPTTDDCMAKCILTAGAGTCP
jgi:hypothetical protein